MSRQIHLIRHGQSLANLAISLKPGDPLIYDAPLSPLGHEQVAAARTRHAAIHYDLVVISPLTRAIQTAVGIFGARDSLALHVEPMHRETVENSCDIGRPPRELAQDFPDLAFGHLPDVWWYTAQDGARNDAGIILEPHHAISERVNGFRTWLAARPEQSIAVVGHGTFFRHLTGTFLDNCGMIALEL